MQPRRAEQFTTSQGLDWKALGHKNKSGAWLHEGIHHNFR